MRSKFFQWLLFCGLFALLQGQQSVVPGLQGSERCCAEGKEGREGKEVIFLAKKCEKCQRRRSLAATATPTARPDSKKSKKASRGELIAAVVTVSIVAVVAVATALHFVMRRPFFDPDNLHVSPLQELA